MGRTAVGIGSNLGDSEASVRAAIAALSALGRVARVSRLYRTRAWGFTRQRDFVNAVVLLETDLAPRALLAALQRLEHRLGRRPGLRWGPRAIDLDILTYDDACVDERDLRIPHPRLHERAFALVPLAEVDPRFEPARDALPERELRGVLALSAVLRAEGGETVALMSEDLSPASVQPGSVSSRVRALAEAFAVTDLMRLRIAGPGSDAVELRRRARVPVLAPPAPESGSPAHTMAVKADLVGIVHLSRPTPVEGEQVDAGRELAYVEALGIRNPVRALGSGRIHAIACRDGQAVEYGQVLFEIDRG